jgi:hypothetical protein
MGRSYQLQQIDQLPELFGAEMPQLPAVALAQRFR